MIERRRVSFNPVTRQINSDTSMERPMPGVLRTTELIAPE
jgi:hypothetical protein